MKLPNIKQAYVPLEKFTAYLLSEENSGGKAAFFFAFGFSLADWKVLHSALLVHAIEHDVVKRVPNLHGLKYIIEGRLITPDKRNPSVRTVWIIEHEQDAARFVTAYPLEGDSDD